MSAGIVDALRPGKRVQEIEPVPELLFQLRLQSVVTEKTAAPRNLNQAEVLNRASCLKTGILSRSIRTRLIVIGKNHEADTVSFDVADIEHPVVDQLLLDRKMIGLSITGLVVGRGIICPHINLLHVGG